MPPWALAPLFYSQPDSKQSDHSGNSSFKHYDILPYGVWAFQANNPDEMCWPLISFNWKACNYLSPESEFSPLRRCFDVPAEVNENVQNGSVNIDRSVNNGVQESRRSR
jgi:hypothetical protein